MLGILAFFGKYRDELACIQSLAKLKWPNGFTCDQCHGREAYHLASRPRVFECAGCGHQHSITAGTVFHKTRTALLKWFTAAYLIGHDKRGVSALFISRELSIRYGTAWLMCHKLRHALTESATDFLLDDCVELAQAFYGGGKPQGNQDHAQAEGEAMMVCAVEKPSTAGTDNKAIDKSGCIAGGARIAVLASGAAEDLVGFIRSNIKPGTLIVSDVLKDRAALDEYGHRSMTQDEGVNAAADMPIVHTLFGNIKAWLNGTHHGVSVKHLPRYLREWCYRFNRRGRIGELDEFVLRRAVGRGTITYAELVAGANPAGA